MKVAVQLLVVGMLQCQQILNYYFDVNVNIDLCLLKTSCVKNPNK